MQLLEIVKSLCEAPPGAPSRPELTTERLEDALDVALRGDPDNGNRYLYVLRSFRAPPTIESVELRVPLRGATRKGPLCIVELAPRDLDLSGGGAPVAALEDVARTFGEATRSLAPRGFAGPRRGARSSETFLVYDRPWGALRFGATAARRYDVPSGAPHQRPKPVLTTIVIDIER